MEKGRRFEEIIAIGSGSCGTVYKAKDKFNQGKYVALKKIDIKTNNEEGLNATVLREISILKFLDTKNHENLIKLYDVIQLNFDPYGKQNSVVLVLEHVELDLSTFLSKLSSPLPLHLIKDLSIQLLEGLDFLHLNRVIHRDMKPQNILILENEMKIKITDFGLARIHCNPQTALTSVVVTLWYRAPELLLGCDYSTAVDLWSIGCIIYELLTLKTLFPGNSELDQLNIIFSVIGTPKYDDWPQNSVIKPENVRYYQSIDIPILNTIIDHNFTHILKKLLIFRPHNRLTASTALANLKNI